MPKEFSIGTLSEIRKKKSIGMLEESLKNVLKTKTFKLIISETTGLRAIQAIISDHLFFYFEIPEIFVL